MNEGVKSNVSFCNEQNQQYIKPQHNKIYFSLKHIHIIYVLFSLHSYYWERLQILTIKDFLFRDMWVFLVSEEPSFMHWDPGPFNPVSPPPAMASGLSTSSLKKGDPAQHLEALSQIWHSDDADGYPAAMHAGVGKQHTGRTDNVLKT